MFARRSFVVLGGNNANNNQQHRIPLAPLRRHSNPARLIQFDDDNSTNFNFTPTTVLPTSNSSANNVQSSSNEEGQ